MARLFHIARRQDWEHALAAGSYRVSTLGRSLDEQGFIHLSFAHQVALVANAIYADIDDLVLLELEPERVSGPVRIEEVPGSPESFPHLYGAITPDAVIAVRPFRAGPGGFPDPAS